MDERRFARPSEDYHNRGYENWIGSSNKTAKPAYTVRASSYTADKVRECTEKLKLITPPGLVFSKKQE